MNFLFLLIQIIPYNAAIMNAIPSEYIARGLSRTFNIKTAAMKKTIIAEIFALFLDFIFINLIS